MEAGRGSGNGSVWLVERKTKPDYFRGAVRLPDGSRKYVEASSRQVAEYLVDQLVKRVADGDPVRPTVVGTVDKECRNWLDWRAAADRGRKKQFTDSSVRTYLSVIESLIGRTEGMSLCIGRISVSKLTSSRVQTWLDELSTAGMSGPYLRKAYNVLSQTLDRLVKLNAIPDNPCARVDRPERKETDAVSLEGPPLEMLMSCIARDRLNLRWYLAVHSGLRPAEAIAIRTKDIHLQGVDGDGQRCGYLIVRGQLDNKGVYQPTTKTKKARTLTLDADLVARFEAHIEALAEEKAQVLASGREWHEYTQDGEHHDFLFRQPDGRKLTVATDTTSWKRIAKEAELPGITRYVARHTAASQLIGNGTDPLTTAHILGHRNPMITLNVYGHALMKSKAAAAGLMTGILTAAAQEGYSAELLGGDQIDLADIREQRQDFGLDTSEIDALIEAEKEAARGGRPKRSPRTL